MQVILFSLYYVKLRLTVLLGIYRTSNPLDIKWRWKNWQYIRDVKRRRWFQKRIDFRRKNDFRLDVKESRENPMILQRIAQRDRTAVEDCLDAYGSRIWAMAKKNAASTEEAETITEEIFLEIWKHAARFDPDKCSETNFVMLLCLRHLIRRARKD